MPLPGINRMVSDEEKNPTVQSALHWARALTKLKRKSRGDSSEPSLTAPQPSNIGSPDDEKQAESQSHLQEVQQKKVSGSCMIFSRAVAKRPRSLESNTRASSLRWKARKKNKDVKDRLDPTNPETETELPNSTEPKEEPITPSCATCEQNVTSSLSISKPCPDTESNEAYAPQYFLDSFLRSTSQVALHDIFSISESLLGGYLGPVAIDLQVLGTHSLLENPGALDRVLTEYEEYRGSNDSLRSLLTSIQPFFFVIRGNFLYSISPSVYQVALPLIAKLLASSNVTTIVKNLDILIRLMSLFLGTDRLEVSDKVVDIGLWSSVLRGLSLPQNALQPPEVRDLESIFLSLSSDNQQTLNLEEDVILRTMMNKRTVGVKAGGAPSAYSENAKGAIEVRIFESTVSTKHSQERGPSDMEEEVNSGLSDSDPILIYRIRKRLRTIAEFYRKYIEPMESLAAGGLYASYSCRDLCGLYTYTSFLANIMTHHGFFVNKDLFESMMSSIDKDVTLFSEIGAACMRQIAPSEAIDSPLSEEAATSQNNLFEKLTGSEVLHLLPTELIQNYIPVSGEVTSYQAGKILERLYQDVSKTVPTDSESSSDAPAENWQILLHSWLGIQERRAFKKTVMDFFDRSHTHLCPRVLYSDTGNGRKQVHLAFSLHPKWCVHTSTTGRLFSSKPNIQGASKKKLIALCSAQAASTPVSEVPALSKRTLFTKEGPSPLVLKNPSFTFRHLFCAPPGCTLVSLDYNQIELRILAHLSGDASLTRELSSDKDVLSQIAANVFGKNQNAEPVTEFERQAIKVLVYGLIYGMGVETMDEKIRKITEARNDPSGQKSISAKGLMDAFFQSYPSVQTFLKDTRQTALREKSCTSLLGKRDLSHQTSALSRIQSALALAIQGSAANILHSAMRSVYRSRRSIVPFLPLSPIALVMAVHDELIFAIPDSLVDIAVPRLKEIMESQSTLFMINVPLRVSVHVGKNLGELATGISQISAMEDVLIS